MPNFEQLLWFMQERQHIYLKKQAGEPWPWTKDEILSKFKFCCSYRECDKVTVWIRDHWRKPYANDKNLWFAMAVARQINWPSTLEAIGYPEKWEPKRVLAIMRKRREQGLQNYSGAYMITADSDRSDMPLVTVDRVLDPLYEFARKYPPDWFDGKGTLEAVWDWFINHRFHHFGPFISYEVVTDLRHTRYLQNASDVMTWANPGPGAKRGLNRLYSRDLKTNISREQLIAEMQEALAYLKKNRDVKLLPTLEMRDCEHLLCELDKYLRAKEAMTKGERVGLELYKRPTKSLFV